MEFATMGFNKKPLKAISYPGFPEKTKRIYFSTVDLLQKVKECEKLL
jgi:hypothetical protein